MAIGAAGESFSFDPEAMQEAARRIRSVADDAHGVRLRSANQQYHAHSLLDELRQALSRPQAVIEHLWNDLDFSGFRAEIDRIRNDIQGLGARVDGIRNLLSNTHRGRLEQKLQDELLPLGSRLIDCHVQAGSASALLISENLDAIAFGQFDLPLILGNVAIGLEWAVAEAGTICELFEWLWQKEIDLIHFEGNALQDLWNFARESPSQTLSFLHDLKDSHEFVWRIGNGKGIEGFHEEPNWGPLGAFDMVWTVLGSDDGSNHGSGSAVAGWIINQAALASKGGPYVLAAQGAVALTSITASTMSFTFSELGKAQGGPWGNALQSVSDSWNQTAKASAGTGRLFTDLGAIFLDAHVGTGVVAATSVVAPEVSPEAATMVFNAELMAGSDPRRLGSDFGHLGQDLSAVPRLAGNIVDSVGKTGAAVTYETAKGIVNVLPLPSNFKTGVEANLAKRFTRLVGGTSQ